MSDNDLNRTVPRTNQSQRLLKPRKKYSEIVQVTILVILFGLCCAGGDPKSDWFLEVCVLVITTLSALVVGEILCRITHLIEEMRHIGSRYQNSFDLLSRLFPIDWKLAIMTSIFFSRFIFERKYIETFDWRLQVRMVFSYLLFHLLRMKSNNVYYSIDEHKGLGYGSGMAQSFFFGYLRLCLPHTGDSEKGIVERIDDYISRRGVDLASFPVKKLFILIPLSTYIPNDLQDVSYNWMTCAESLEEQEKTRAGVKQRIYKNTVYRIKDPHNVNDPEVYVVAEGATPLKTFNEVVQFSGNRRKLYEANKSEITFKFFETLKETLAEHEECRNLCELIYYDDIDENGDYVNIAYLILERIEKIKEKEERRSRR